VLDYHYDRLINITIANCSKNIQAMFNFGNLTGIGSKLTYGHVKTKQNGITAVQ
jgi:hypothetical protein